MKKLIVCICLMLLSTGYVAGATNSVAMGLSIGHYIVDRYKWNMAKFLDAYLMGLTHGIIYLNNEMAQVLPKEMVRGHPYMTTICASEHLNIKDVRKVLDNELRDNTYSLSLKVGLPLTNGLRKKYPCSY